MVFKNEGGNTYLILNVFHISYHIEPRNIKVKAKFTWKVGLMIFVDKTWVKL